MEYRLEEIAIYGNKKIEMDKINKDNYISTENILPNKAGVVKASSLPNQKSVCFFEKSNILISNIRPYFKKIWFANYSGGCSNDVLNIIVKDDKKVLPKFLYYILFQDDFFDYVMIGNKGTKMPRGDKNHIMKYIINIPKIEMQIKIVNILESLDKKIELNNHINNNLFNLGRSYYDNWKYNCDKEITIKEVSEEILDYSKKNKNYIKLLNSSDVTEGSFPNLDYIENKDLKGHFKKNFKKYDILYSQIRPRNHHFGIVLFDDADNYIASTRLMVIRNKPDKISSSLLYFVITSDEAVDDFTAKTESRSGTFPQGNYEDLSSFRFKYSNSQKDITSLLDSILDSIYLNQLENYRLEKLRDILLPKLMNREINLDKIEV